MGLHIDNALGKVIESPIATSSVDNNDEKANEFLSSVGRALNTDELDNHDFYEQVDFFVRLLEEKKLLIRKTLDPNHAKLYLFKIKDEVKKRADKIQKEIIIAVENVAK